LPARRRIGVTPVPPPSPQRGRARRRAHLALFSAKKHKDAARTLEDALVDDPGNLTAWLNLGLLNLMPIPVLDGGHITILALEGLARRDFSMRVKEKLLIGGFVLLLMLMVTVIYNDLTRVQWIEKLMFWR
jgi:hypothetical protein